VLIERIVAPNPGPMTLTGTNTYLVGDGSGELLAIDPGPEEPAHMHAILSAAARVGRITRVLVTHRHLDHLPAALPLCRESGAILVGHRDLPGVQQPVADSETVFGDLVALETPGHTRDSVCLWSAGESALFTGDLVLGTGTAVLDDQPGALGDYLASLRRLAELTPRVIYPGHGPIIDDGSARLTEYIDHRHQRVNQVVDALASNGPRSSEELARLIYVDTPANLLPMAARNVRANLEMLLSQNRVERLGSDRWRLSRT
jgi:glyoxylase-like metal-dependent hydrolase (beta-lactamase superfamily II)